MHAEAQEWLSRFKCDDRLQVLEVGSRIINGTARVHWPNAHWVGMDLVPGFGVSVVGDFCDQAPAGWFDLVVCCEVLEHCDRWNRIVARSRLMLQTGGRFIGTCAGPQRAPHSAVDGGKVRAGEHYANLDSIALMLALQSAGYATVVVRDTGVDLQWFATV